MKSFSKFVVGVGVVASLMMSSPAHSVELKGDLVKYEKPIELCLEVYALGLDNMIAMFVLGGKELPSESEMTVLDQKAVDLCLCKYAILSVTYNDPSKEKHFISDMAKSEEFLMKAMNDADYGKSKYQANKIVNSLHFGYLSLAQSVDAMDVCEKSLQ